MAARRVPVQLDQADDGRGLRVGARLDLRAPRRRRRRGRRRAAAARVHRRPGGFGEGRAAQPQALKGELKIKWIGPLAGQVERDVVGDGDESAAGGVGRSRCSAPWRAARRAAAVGARHVQGRARADAHAARDAGGSAQPGDAVPRGGACWTTVAPRTAMSRDASSPAAPSRSSCRCAAASRRAKIPVRYDFALPRPAGGARAAAAGPRVRHPPRRRRDRRPRGGRDERLGAPRRARLLDAQGNGTIPRGTLQAPARARCPRCASAAGTPARAAMVTDAMIAMHGMRRTLRLGDAALGLRIRASARPPSSSTRIATSGFVEPETRRLRGRPHALPRAHVLVRRAHARRRVGGGARALEVHHQMSAFVANGATDYGVCRLGMPLLIGEVIIVRPTPARPSATPSRRAG